MKKIFLMLGMILLLSGCGKYSDKNLIKDMNKMVNSKKSYHMIATLDIYRNENKYSYNVDSSYKKGDLFKVSLVNKNNDHEQIIIKNEEGVFVLTPSLNKCFKFQSDWPYNTSQVYLLQPILTDLENEDERSFKTTTNGYIITSKVDYPTEKDYAMQKVYVDKNKNITKVEVVDKNDSVKMRLKIKNIEYNTKFNSKYFDPKTYQKEVEEETDTKKKDKDVSKIDDVIYPMYVPTDTYLTAQDVVETDVGERAILTFAGDSNFTIVQETVKDTGSSSFVYGDPYLVLDTVGAITDNMVSWISNGIEYSVMSQDMDKGDLVSVAKSISVEAISK